MEFWISYVSGVLSTLSFIFMFLSILLGITLFFAMCLGDEFAHKILTKKKPLLVAFFISIFFVILIPTNLNSNFNSYLMKTNEELRSENIKLKEINLHNQIEIDNVVRFLKYKNLGDEFEAFVCR